jgi:hypothetical protein
VQDGDCHTPRERGLELAEPNHGLAGLVAHCKCIERSSFQQLVSQLDKIARNANVTLEAPLEAPAVDREFERLPRTRNPSPSAR